MVTLLFIHFHPLYKFLYFIYKHITDHKQISWVKSVVNEGMTVVDIGANIGFYSILLSRLVGKSGKVYAFEPDVTNFELLMKNTKRYKNIHLFNVAVGEKDETITLYLSKHMNVDHHTYKTDEARDTRKITCISLNTFFAKKGRIDFIKSDIQGFDYFAMKGARKLITRQKHIAILSEFWPYGLMKAGVSAKEYLQLLNELKLKVTLSGQTSYATLEKDKTYYTDLRAIK